MKKFFTIIFIFSPFLIYSQWINQNPVPDGNRLRAVFFVDDNTGWIVGSGGFIIKTTNAGIDWIQQNSGTNEYIKSVYFADVNDGWAVGEQGLILKTTDGGNYWIQVPSGVTDTLNNVKFINSGTGWIFGYNGIILKSTDSGNSWNTQNSGTTYPLFSSDFTTQDLGWVVGANINDPYNLPVILKTTNGGSDWVSQTVNVYGILYSVDFVDSLTGWAAGDWYPNRGMIPRDGYLILKTTDGGNNWIIQSQNTAIGKITEKRKTEILNPIPEDGPGGIYSIFFKDENNGWTVSGHNSYDRKIMATTNGGANWTIEYYPNDGLWNEENDLYSVFVTNEGNGWAVGLGGGIFIKEAGDDKWAQQFSGSGGGGADDIRQLFMLNENVGWMTGIRENYFNNDDPVILKTTDSGNIWKTQYYNYGIGLPITSIFFIDQFTGWTIDEESQLYHTIDGGNNWSSIGFAAGGSNSQLFFEDANTGFCSSSDAGVYKTTDGGTNWSQKNSSQINSLIFINNVTGIAVGSNGIIIKSSDNGETWELKNSGVTSSLNNLDFYNSEIGMAVGVEGSVTLTTDGGESWTPKSSSSTENLNSVSFSNASHIWVSGNNGTLLETTDLGNNWFSNDTLSTTDLKSISFVNGNTGWTAGPNGTLFKYISQAVPPPLWSNQIIVQDAGGSESASLLTFGQNPIATDSIDLSLGEYMLPPIPPSGIFDARLDLPTVPEVSSPVDFRDTSSVEIYWVLAFQPGSAGYPMTFSWDSSAFPEGTFKLIDRINGTIVNVNMKNQSSYLLSNSAITTLEIDFQKAFCSNVSVDNQWNMISVPVLTDNMSVENLFPSATSSAFGYQNGYVIVDTLASGIGYWLKFGANQEIPICGSVLNDTISVDAGWNLIGTFQNDISVDQITAIPEGIIRSFFFGFQNGYFIADTLKTGKGYWINVNQSGQLVLTTNISVAANKQGNIKNDDQWGKIRITDNNGKSIILYASGNKIQSDLYKLPPLPPNGIFDVRYSSGNFVESLDTVHIIQISSDNYPVSILVENLDVNIQDMINGNIINTSLNNGEELKINNNNVKSIKIAGFLTGSSPTFYELSQNYPNPFNPETKIKFSVPKEIHVNLTVYNMLGEKVKELKNSRMKPGFYEVDFNGYNLASGVYFYRIEAGNFVQTKKMLLLK